MEEMPELLDSDFFLSSASPLQGRLKTTPEDFQVRECTTSTTVLSLDSDASPVPVFHFTMECKDEVIVDIELYIGKYEDQLQALNNWIDAPKDTIVSESEVLFPMPSSNAERRVIHAYLSSKYAQLKYETVKQLGEDLNSEELKYSCRVRRDDAYLPLLEHLTLEDVKLLYAFKNAGPREDTLVIGRGLARENRTVVYKVITESNRGIDTKTVTLASEDNVQAMSVYWRKYKGGGKRKRDENTSNYTSVSTASITTEVVEMSYRSNRDVHLHFTMRKSDIEQLDAFRHICSLFPADNGVSLADFHTAGTKDRRAITVQRVSLCIRGVLTAEEMTVKVNSLVSSLSKCCSSSVACSAFSLEPTALSTGCLWGNSFRICIRHTNLTINAISHQELHHRLSDQLAVISTQGFPNLYGSQRMGILYENLQTCKSHIPIGPTVGKLLVIGEYSEAIKAIVLGNLYFTDALEVAVDELDSSYANNARRMYKSDAALSLVYSLFPTSNVRERLLIKGLQRLGYNDPLASYLWNAVCFYRLRKHGATLADGDLVLSESDGQVRVFDGRASTDDASSTSVKRVVLPLFGSRVQYPSGEAGSFYKSLLEREAIAASHSSRFYPKGAYRNILQTPEDARVLSIDPSADGRAWDASLEFRLPAGCFATALLRELMNNHALL